MWNRHYPISLASQKCLSLVQMVTLTSDYTCIWTMKYYPIWLTVEWGTGCRWGGFYLKFGRTVRARTIWDMTQGLGFIIICCNDKYFCWSIEHSGLMVWLITLLDYICWYVCRLWLIENASDYYHTLFKGHVFHVILCRCFLFALKPASSGTSHGRVTSLWLINLTCFELGACLIAVPCWREDFY